MKKLLTITTMLVSILFASNSFAEQKKTLGNWDVHYIAVESTFLTPEVARAYGIVRSKNSVLINISVLDKSTKKAQSVAVMGSARNLLGTEKELSFKEVVDGDAIYYLAILPIRDEEHYRFNIRLRQGNTQQTLKFEQKVYKG